jgi:hypothetical protein
MHQAPYDPAGTPVGEALRGFDITAQVVDPEDLRVPPAVAELREFIAGKLPEHATRLELPYSQKPETCGALSMSAMDWVTTFRPIT